MNFVSAITYPIAFLLPVNGAALTPSTDEVPFVSIVEGAAPVEVRDGGVFVTPKFAGILPQLQSQILTKNAPFAAKLWLGARPQEALQVRIERRVIMRIMPYSRAIAQPIVSESFRTRSPRSRVTERKIGNCLLTSVIRGVRPDRDNRLLLFTQDNRVIAVELEHACRSRDFYSGFLFERSGDGQMCVERDKLVPRSGGDCKVTRIRELIETGR